MKKTKSQRFSKDSGPGHHLVCSGRLYGNCLTTFRQEAEYYLYFYRPAEFYDELCGQYKQKSINVLFFCLFLKLFRGYRKEKFAFLTV